MELVTMAWDVKRLPRPDDERCWDVMLSETRDMAAAGAFFRQQVTSVTPARLTTDGHNSYPRAVRTELGDGVRHRTNCYLNNSSRRTFPRPCLFSPQIGEVKWPISCPAVGHQKPAVHPGGRPRTWRGWWRARQRPADRTRRRQPSRRPDGANPSEPGIGFCQPSRHPAATKFSADTGEY
jgi:hypothetical protein